MSSSDCFRTLFPEAPRKSGYLFFSEYEVQENRLSSIHPVLSPVETDEGHTIYVCREEELAYYSKKDPDDEEEIIAFLYG